MTLQEAIAAGLPLNDTHVQAANILQEIEHRALPVLDGISDCGINCDNEKAMIVGNANFARAVKRNFMSDQI